MSTSNISSVYNQDIPCTHDHAYKDEGIPCYACAIYGCVHHMDLKNFSCDEVGCKDVCSTCGNCTKCECSYTCRNHTIKNLNNSFNQ